MGITREEFGTVPGMGTAFLFRFDGGDGVTAAITNFGGVITSLRTPDRDGKPGEIGLGYETLAQYIAKPGYYGALIGRVGNRIAGGRFTLDGMDYRLNTNNGANHLHGGIEGFNRKLWTAEIDGDELVLTYVSPDGEEHYPGTLTATVRYSLRGRDLRLEYSAVTDKPTLVNLTNHEFFNLNGAKRDILAHELRLDADRYTPVDDTLIPTGEEAPVADTPFDFQTAKAIGRDMGQVPGGYDHNFVFRAGGGAEDWRAEAYDPDSGRTLAMATTEPCVQFYAGNFLDGDIGIGGTAYKKNFAFCLEAQKHPDAVNHPNFASTVLRPGETYAQSTVYRFGVRD